MFNLKFTPELIFMLPLALFLDILGLLFTCCGLDDLGIVDITGMMFIFTWLIIRGHRPPSLNNKKGVTGIFRKIFTNKYLKFITPAVGEIMPIVGGIGFFWTMSVLFTLTEPEADPENKK